MLKRSKRMRLARRRHPSRPSKPSNKHKKEGKLLLKAARAVASRRLAREERVIR